MEKDFCTFRISVTGQVFITDLELLKLIQAEKSRLAKEETRVAPVALTPQQKPAFVSY